MDQRAFLAQDDYRIEKQRLAATVTLAGGAVLPGHLFVAPPLPGHTSADDPAVMLNDRDPFLPFESDGGEVLLLAKAQIAEVAGLPAAEEDELIQRSAPMALMEVRLTDGVRRFGSMRLEIRTGRPRVVDFLNDASQHFLTLYTDQGVRLINRAWIVCVRPLD